ncbi:MAG: NAD(P)-binding domain-containing protein [Devosia nanyangense]|uniref:NAD(P)-binding domain-containing protein n=1 Tax=Devosia nanyangense TaxID=1228055 RepID=A0A933P0Z7_9HYPH|nr:NAD(P)-binding domain-containing protein [Devosia nanyangense]
MQIGFIGTGTISAAVIEGLQSLPEAPDIVVSPRSEATSLALAARFAKVRRATSNAEVAKADIVFLGMRPMHLEEAIAGIGFGEGQIVVSMVAGFALSDIQGHWPKARACRFIPLPGVARGIGPMATYPAIPEIVKLFSPLGDLFVVADETKLNFGGLNAFMSAYYELQRALIDVGTSAGVSETDARGFVVSMLGMLAVTAQHTPAASFDRLVEEHQTKGGLNERVRTNLLATGWFDVPAAVLRETTTLNYGKLG